MSDEYVYNAFSSLNGIMTGHVNMSTFEEKIKPDVKNSPTHVQPVEKEIIQDINKVSAIEFKEIMLPKVIEFQTKNHGRKPTIEECLELFLPQGASMSINHKISVPGVDNFIDAATKSMSGIPSMGGLNNLRESLSNQSGKLKLFNFKFWLFMTFLLTFITDIFPPKDISQLKNIRAIRYIFMSMLLICCLLSPEEFDEERKNFINPIKDFFWDSIFPLWQIENVELDFESTNEVNMEEVFTPQSFSEHVPKVSAILATMLSLLIGFKVKKHFIDALTTLTKVNTTQITNITTFIVMLSGGISTILTKMGQKEMSEYFDIDVCDSIQVSKFSQKSSTFINRITAGDIYSSAFHSEVYFELIREGEELIRKVEKNSYDYRVISDILRKLRDCSDKVDVIKKALNGTRIEPVGVLISGVPGCFKGVLAERLATIVGSHTIPSEWKEEYDSDPKQFHFAIPNDRFFDRYNYKKWIATADDIFQIRDTVGDPDSEAVRVIKMINSAEYVLPMSSVTEKNSMFFRSAFLFGTTNIEKINSSSVVSSEAVTRRFNVQIKVGISEKYKTELGKTDLNKLPRLSYIKDDVDTILSDATVVPNDYWELNVISRDGNTEERFYKLSLEDVAIMIISAHHKRIKNFYVNKYMDEFQHKTLSNVLLNRLPRMEIFSQMALNTFTAQSGLPGAYGLKETVDDRWSFSSAWSNSNEDLQREISEQYFNMLGRKCYIDLFNLGWAGLNNFFSTLTDQETLLFRDKFHFLDEFMELVSCFFEDRVRLRKHPITNVIMIQDRMDKALVFKKIKGSLKNITGFIHDNRVVIIIGGAFVLGGVLFLSGFFRTTIGNAFKSQSVDLSKDRAKVGKQVRLYDKVSSITLRPQAPEMLPLSKDVLPKIDVSLLGNPSNANDVAIKILNKYHFIVYVIRPVGDSYDVIRLGHAWNIKGNVFMMPLHFMYKLHDVHKLANYAGATLLFTTSTKSTKYTCTLEDILRSFKCSEDSANNDSCLFQIPSAHKSSVGMIKHIAKLGDLNRLKKLSSFKVNITGTYLGKEQNSNSVRMLKTTAFFLTDAFVKTDWQSEEQIYRLEAVLKYSGEFGGGDCGSLLTIESNDFENRTVFGMHVAGECQNGKDYGISSVIVQEYIQLLMDDSYSNYYIFDDEEDCPRLEILPYTAQSGLVPFAKLESNSVTGEVGKSELVKSALFGKLPEPYRKVEHFPARLLPFTNKEKNMIDPGIKALSKYDKEPIHFQEGLVERAVASYEGLITKHMNPSFDKRRKISLKEALHSFDSVKGISPSTSPGFPMNLANEENIKKLYYKAVENKNLEETLIYYRRIAVLVDYILSCYDKGIRPSTFYKGVLKDELRPIAKINEGSTRYFSAYSFPMLLLFRMYFGSFMSSFIDANVNVGSAIGVNAYSRDWDQIARNLLRFSEKKNDKRIGAGDFSGFDTCHRVQIQMAILDMINRWYGHDNPDNAIRTKLWTDITNSRQIYRNEVYEWYNGMPSGNPLTSLINTIYNNVVFRMSYQLAGFDYSTFNSNVYLIAMGDDNVFTVSDDLVHHFNEMTLVNLMDKCGMKYTTELKDVATLPFRNITEIEFLKRRFRFDVSCNRWVAPMRLEAIFCTLNWTKKGIEGDQITADKVSSAVSEISLHGKTVFNQLVGPLCSTLFENLPYATPSKDIIFNYEVVYSDVLKNEFMY